MADSSSYRPRISVPTFAEVHEEWPELAAALRCLWESRHGPGWERAHDEQAAALRAKVAARKTEQRLAALRARHGEHAS